MAGIAESVIIEELLKAHSDYGIISEEAGIINKSNKKKLRVNKCKIKFYYYLMIKIIFNFAKID